jgi:transcriptional regulator of aromatic amino acid metabolism
MRYTAMRRWILSAALALVTLSNVGCMINQYSSDPNERMLEMLNESENLRQIRGEWQRFWMIDQPSHLSPIRIHGGVGY